MEPIKIYITNVSSKIVGEFTPKIAEALDEELSFEVAGSKYAVSGWEAKHRAKMAEQNKAKRKHALGRRLTPTEEEDIDMYWARCELAYKWDGRHHFWDKRSNTIPTGLVKRTRKFLQEYGEVIIVDRREPPPKKFHNWRMHDFTPFEDQRIVAERAVAKQRGIIRLPTGSGKTEIIGMIIAALGVRTLVVIHRETIMRDIVRRLYKRLRVPIGEIGGGKFEPDVITVAMLQTVMQPRFERMIREFPAVIADEAHHLKASEFNRVLMGCDNAFYRFATTATVWNDSNDFMHIEAATGPFIANVSPSQMITAGRLTKPKIYFINNPAIEEFKKLSWQKQYGKCVVENEYRNRMACQVAYNMWKQGKTVLLAVTQIAHGKTLLKMMTETYPKMKGVFIQGENDSAEKQRALKNLNDRLLDFVIATTVFGEGVDVPTLDGIVNCKGNESRIETLQLIGRCLRYLLGKHAAYYVDFFDNEKYTYKHSVKRLETLESEAEFEVVTCRNMAAFEKTFGNDVAMESI